MFANNLTSGTYTLSIVTKSGTLNFMFTHLQNVNVSKAGGVMVSKRKTIEFI